MPRETLGEKANRLESANQQLTRANTSLSLNIQQLQRNVEALENPTLPPPTPIRLNLMEEGVSLILQGMGVDTEHPDFIDTPKRVAKMYKAMLTPEPNN